LFVAAQKPNDALAVLPALHQILFAFRGSAASRWFSHLFATSRAG
jgi:hypothetical protein